MTLKKIMSRFYFNNQRYYTSLKQDGGLLSEHKKDIGCMNIIVRQEYISNDFNCRRFMIFDSYLEFYFFLKKLKPEERTFHEYVNISQHKPFFDIDVSSENDNITVSKQVVNNLIKALITFFAEKNIPFSLDEDIMIFSSCSKEINKGSFHLILRRYMVDNLLECKSFVNQVCNLMDTYERKFIDKQYINYKSLRTFMSIKDGREKIYVNEWIFKGKLIQFNHKNFILNKDLSIFYDSLVSNTASTKKLNFGYIPEEIPVVEYSNIDDVDVNYVMTLVEEKYPNSFKLKEATGIIRLKNINSYKCNICMRIHTNQNPYVIISKTGSILFYCRQNTETKYEILGNINSESESNNTSVEKPMKEIKNYKRGKISFNNNNSIIIKEKVQYIPCEKDYKKIKH